MNDKRWQHAILPFVTTNMEGVIIQVNDQFVEFVGYSADELIGSHIEMIMDNGVKFFFNSMLYPKLLMEKKAQEVYISFQTKAKGMKHVMFNAQVEEAEQLIYCYIAPVAQRMEYMKEIRSINRKLEETIEEKTRLHDELAALNLELKHHAERDWLTGLYNRRVFIEKLEETYDTFQQTDRPFSICILDVDHFKQVNDQYGHHIGDQVLIGLADMMKGFFGSDCTLARFGGEEFIILLPDHDKNEAYEKADQFREKIKTQSWQGVSITVSSGIGTVSYPIHIDELIVKADGALYKAKREGRDRVMTEE